MNPLKFVLVAIVASLLPSCLGGGKAQSDSLDGNDLTFDYARFIKVTRHTDGWYQADIKNPWDTTKLLQRVAMIPSDVNPNIEEIPYDAIVVDIPLKRALVQESVHVGLIEEFGADDAIAGVSDVDYILSSSIKERIEKGEVIDCGSWMRPDMEKIIRLRPDGILMSPYQNGGNFEQLSQLNIPIIFTADYTESTPLGRAEWIKYFGLLFGHESSAASIFNDVSTTYNDISQRADSLAAIVGHKKILLDIPYRGTWYVPGKASPNQIFIENIGAENPFASMVEGSSVALPPEKVLYEAHDADVWVIRVNTSSEISLDYLEKNYPIATQFKAFQEGKVWGCNTGKTPYFEETPFHPEYQLRDLFNILYEPDSLPLRYFRQLQ